MAQSNFSHLPLPLKIKDRAYLTGGGQPSEATINNNNNRESHGRFLENQAARIKNRWKQKIDLREMEGLPPLPLSIPILLEIDPNVDCDFLRSFGFEVVSEQEDGFVVIATENIEMVKFFDKVDKFSNSLPRSGSAANIHQIHGVGREDLRLQRILSEEMYSKWSIIQDDNNYIVDIGVECLGTLVIPEPIEQKENEHLEQYNIRKSRWEDKVRRIYSQLEDIRLRRESEIEQFVNVYGGEILDMFEEYDALTSLSDSFTVRVRINGKGLKDISLNFPYVFEITEPEDVFLGRNQNEIQGLDTHEVEILPPDEDAPKICIIDSGILEGHRMLAPAIDSLMSACFLPHETDSTDKVRGGGHGTRVAGAVLYPMEIPKSGTIQLPFWLQNARVLNEFNGMPRSIFPPLLLRKIIEKYYVTNNTRIFNHSIAGFAPFRLQHMSSWAAEMDDLSYENDILFIQAAGNIIVDHNGPFRYGITQHLTAGRSYPNYLLEASCRMPSPAQSLQSITVGSICHAELNEVDRSSLGEVGSPSAFSATGLGIWGTIKPDVVEYGGTYVVDRGNPATFTSPAEVCPELLRSTPPAYGNDAIGTSFATPKVTHLAGMLQKILPEEPTLLYRALIAQSARWPQWALNKPINERKNVIKHMGYGIPDIERATLNSPYRVTLFTSGSIGIFAKEAHVYEIPIPDTIRSVGEEYDILIEVTLSYTAKPRRTRKKLRGYLSTWLDWKTSNIGESTQSFSNRVLYGRNHNDRDDEGGIPWTIGNRTNHGIEGISRNYGTLQKDWAVIKSHQLTDGFNIAVIGHPGWNKDPNVKAFYSLVVSFEAINRDIEIYEPIRTSIETEIQTQLEAEIELELNTNQIN